MYTAVRGFGYPAFVDVEIPGVFHTRENFDIDAEGAARNAVESNWPKAQQVIRQQVPALLAKGEGAALKALESTLPVLEQKVTDAAPAAMVEGVGKTKIVVYGVTGVLCLGIIGAAYLMRRP
jgi:hypothetical protein